MKNVAAIISIDDKQLNIFQFTDKDLKIPPPKVSLAVP